MKMFRSATVRLTLGYLALIMGISLIFSVVLYRIASAGIENGFHRQRGIILSLPRFDGLRNPSYLDILVDEQIAKETRQLLINLILANLAVLVAGGGAAYLLSRQTLQPIEDALAAQTRFAADASHELRTPLTAMKSEIEVALRDKQLGEVEAREVLKSSLEEVDKLDKLATSLLKLAQRRGELELEVSTAKVLEIVDEAALRLAKTAAQKDIAINVTVPASLEVEASRTGLVELVAILVDNAIKYSPTGSPIDIRASTDGHRLRLQVADKGMGIEPSVQEHIFDRFYRADSSRNKSKTGGYGLGLAIAGDIVRQHQGRISLQSKPGQGTTMIVRLPLRAHRGVLATFWSHIRQLV